MFYKGQIEQIDRVVVSDPSYAADVWCRYEGQNFASGGPWKVQLAINDVSENVDGFDIKGVDFSMLLYTGNEKLCVLKPDGTGFSHPSFVKMKEFEIGMDTACVALGINGVADEIKASRGEWKPGCSLNTMTDGLFGNVYEGSCYGKTHLLYVSGYLDEDTGYSLKDIVDYLVSNFEIKKLELVKEEPAIDAKISSAEQKKVDDNDLNGTTKIADVER